jgi:hypothetical protein
MSMGELSILAEIATSVLAIGPFRAVHLHSKSVFRPRPKVGNSRFSCSSPFVLYVCSATLSLMLLSVLLFVSGILLENYLFKLRGPNPINRKRKS